FLTRDNGLFLGTIFKPTPTSPGITAIPEAKPGMLLDEYSMGNEIFHGSFARAEATVNGFEKGRYYMLGLGASIVVELTGLDSIQRLPGDEITVPNDFFLDARQGLLRQIAEKYLAQETHATFLVPANRNVSAGSDRGGGNWG